MITIRKASLDDIGAITAIYNEAIVNTVATFDIKPKSLGEQEDWFRQHGPKYPILVAEQDSVIVGWASLSKWSDRSAYSDTAECSLYIDEGYRGKGIGGKLSKAIIQSGRESGLHTLIARVVEGNEESMHLCEIAGFKHIGTMKQVGRKFGKTLDVHLMQLIFDE